MLTSRYPPAALVSAIVAIAGLLAVGIGGFLPWVRSGLVVRSSFEIAGIAERLGSRAYPILDVMFACWVAIPLVCVICVGLFTLGLLRSAAASAIIVSLLAGTVALATYVLGSGGSGAVAVVGTGPLTTCIGAAVALAGSVGALLGRRGGRPSGIA
ncbi:hypothetical protein [Thermocrispum agreste]|uniref:Uncharacterized protein n=1 Tax=Thermocrispum agreste TaxID=37925 RepID=A0A2W4IYA1_9PSEU|nr:hypothetical protein [Thermocrispum agreste]PZM91564.1 MAG: hypothetical protein DIU77_16705 [Thermocrispum agreste]